MLGDINWLQLASGLTSQKLSNLFSTLQDDKNLNSPRKLSAQAVGEIDSRKKILNDTHVDHFNQ